MTRNGFDEIDKLLSSCHVTYCTLGALLYSIVSHVVDVCYDYYISFFEYLEREKYAYFLWTVVLVILSSIIITSISIRMYIEDSKNNSKSGFKRRIVLNGVGMVFQSALLIRSIDSFRYAIKSLKGECKNDKNKQEVYFSKMIREDADIVVLKVFECYLESAPQLVLQISLMLIEYSYHSKDLLIQQSVMIIINFFSMAYSMANYHRCIRIDQDDKKNISNLGLLAQLLWHLNITVSRILALSALVSINPLWASFIVVHWCGLTIWLTTKRKTNFFGKNLVSEFFFAGAVGLVYIFNFISFKEGPTRNIYLVFYGICFTENLIMSVLWGFHSFLMVENWIYYFFLIVPTCTFLLGVIFMVIYYKFLHPSKST